MPRCGSHPVSWAARSGTAGSVARRGVAGLALALIPMDPAYRLVIFDFDGTIADTRESIVTTVHATLERLGRPSLPTALIEELIGLPLTKTFQAAGLGDCALDDAVRIYRELYDDAAFPTVRLFPEAAETLAGLRAMGVRLAIASSKGKAAIQKILQRFSIMDLFDAIGAEQDVARKKPAPDLALFVLQKCGIAPPQAIVVGDTVYDMEMGREAGCDTCGARYGYGCGLESARATYSIDRVADLIDIVSRS
jgi:phosphoglycolate phosphatase